MTDVIEISGSEEDDDVRTKLVVVSRRRRTSSLSAISYRSQSYRGDVNGVESDVDLHPHNRHPKPGTERARVRRIIQSSGSSSSEEEEERVFNQAGGTPRIKHPGVVDVIEISDSDNEVEDVLGGREPPFGRCRPPPPPPQALPPFDEEHDQTDIDDDGLLILNDPKSARRPLPRLHRPQTPRTTAASPPDRQGYSGEREDAHGLVQAFSTLSSLTTLTDSDSENNARLVTAGPVVSSTASPTHLLLRPSANALAVPATPKTPSNAASSKPKCTPTKTPRTSKKALAQAEQAERAAYAQSLFGELNRTVFAGGLPAETSLVWSNRLLTTAGRARWHRSKEGVHTTSIELATKILDSKERIRNTLSHEMCHLACWIINQDPKEGHGKAWKSWAAKVMRKRADIDISTRHNYEISYPYEWECENCAKTYGRFSKSIRPDEVVCGACKTGTLHPLFTVRPKKTTVNSRMAATSPRDSPRAAVPVGTGTGVKMPGSFGHHDDDDELDELIQNINRLGVD